MLVCQWISQVPPHCLHNHLAWVLASLERIGYGNRHGFLPYQILPSKLRNGTPIVSSPTLFVSDTLSCGAEFPLPKSQGELPVHVADDTSAPNQVQTALLVQLHRPTHRYFDTRVYRKLIIGSKQHAGTAD